MLSEGFPFHQFNLLRSVSRKAVVYDNAGCQSCMGRPQCYPGPGTGTVTYSAEIPHTMSSSIVFYNFINPTTDKDVINT